MTKIKLTLSDRYRDVCSRVAIRIYNRFCFHHEERECQVDGYQWPMVARVAYVVAMRIDREAW